MPDLPDWQPVADVAALPPEPGAEAGRVVVAVATETAARAGWGPGAALELARSWSEQGRRVILVDGVLSEPGLHRAAGVTNREGLTDATLYGASLGRVALRVGDGSLFLVTAGTPIVDPHQVVRSGRWHRLSSAITEAGATLLLYVRDEDSGTAAFLGSASDIVVIGAPDDEAPRSIRDLEPLVRAVAGSGTSVPVDVREPVREAVPAEPSAGLGRMVLLVVAAVVVAAGLGFVLSSVL